MVSKTLRVWEISDFLHLSVRGRSKLIKKRKTFQTIFFIYLLCPKSCVKREKLLFEGEENKFHHFLATVRNYLFVSHRERCIQNPGLNVKKTLKHVCGYGTDAVPKMLCCIFDEKECKLLFIIELLQNIIS